LILKDNLPLTVNALDYAPMPGCITINGTLGSERTSQTDVTIEKWDGTKDYWEALPKLPSGMERAVDEIVQYLDGGFTFP
jgi:hypothetical protein